MVEEGFTVQNNKLVISLKPQTAAEETEGVLASQTK